jgi:hypothetical protein
MPGKELTLSIPRSDKESGETKINAEEWPSISRTFGQTKREQDCREGLHQSSAITEIRGARLIFPRN